MAITRDATWWRSAVIYQIYPKSWADGNGDGYGDIAGIRARLAYLSRLGVDALWLSPWFPSPQADGGYDVADFRDIDPMFGDLGQAQALIDEAHDLGLKVIIDIVPNHTSDQHRFFQEALASPPGSPAWSRYHCVRGTDGGAAPPSNWRSAFGGPAWDPVLDPAGDPTGWWYLHLFDARQPDLNWEHPEVREEFLETLRFWFDRGVDGFRIDVATGLIKAPGYPTAETGERSDRPYWNLPEVHEIWREWRRVANAYEPPRAFVGEVWVDDVDSFVEYLRPDELHTAFNFEHLRCPWDADTLRAVVDRSLEAATRVGAASTWVLENHDVPRARTKYGIEAAGASMPRSNTHPTPAVEPDDPRGLARARAGLLFMLGLPGSAYLYQGQELGLPEVVDLPPSARQDPAFARTNGAEGFRDGCRVPLPWSRSGASFGFGSREAPWLPQPSWWGDLSVEAQEDDPGSTLALTRAALRRRRLEPVLGDGQMEWVATPSPSTLALRRLGGPDESGVTVAINMGSDPVRLEAREVLLTSCGALTADSDGVVLPPDGAAWLR